MPRDFTAPEVKELQEIYAGHGIRIIYPLRPIIEQHIMLVPERVVEHVRDLNAEETSALFSLVAAAQKVFAKKYSTEDFNLFVNDGKAAGQNAPHVHFHMFGRSKDESINPYAVMGDPHQMKSRPTLSLDELAKRVGELRKLFQTNT